MESKIIHLNFIVLFLVFSSLINSNLVGQDISKDELDKRALENFRNENYAKAAIDFQTLHNLFPKDPRISYYLGRSYLQTNQKLEDACDMLKLAAIRNYGEDSYFFLGRAYQLTYQFDDAEMAYSTFKKTVSSHLAKEFDVDYWLGTNKNAKELSVVSAKINVTGKTLTPSNAPESVFNDLINGKYIYVPDALKSKDDIALSYQTLMFVNDNVKPGNYLYFSSHSKNSKQGLDIFRTKRLTASDYSQPEPLSAVINTRYDEEFPFYDAATGTLFFSSKGHTTSGGYDIFSTRFDSLTNEWKTPERLPFPINTPFDDFLYTVNKENSTAIFLTNRNEESNEFMTITYSIKSPVEYISPSGRNEILELATLSSSEPDVQVPMVEKNKGQTQKAPELTDALQNPTPVQKVETKGPDYDLLILQALGLQARTDSINSAIKDMQKKSTIENDYRKKQELNANIISMDKESKRMQKLANDKFNEAEKLHAVNNNPASEQYSAKVKDELPGSGSNNAPGQKKEGDGNSKDTQTGHNEYSKGLEAASIAGQEINKSFQIMDTSPYSMNNPIPMKSNLPTGLVYRIQLAAYAGRVAENAFRGLFPLSSETVQGKNVIRYFVGYFSVISEARKALESVKKYGYPDAFLVSYFNGEKITIEKAREIEFAEK